MPDIKTVKDFLNSEQADYASYSTLRAIGSLIDGLKNSSRKIVRFFYCGKMDKFER